MRRQKRVLRWLPFVLPVVLTHCAVQRPPGGALEGRPSVPAASPERAKADRSPGQDDSKMQRNRDGQTGETSRRASFPTPPEVLSGLLRAELQLNHEDDEGAYETLLSLTKRYRNVWLARRLYGIAAGTDDAERMLTAARLWTQSAPDDPQGWTHLWLLLAERGKPGEALEAFARYAALTPASLDRDLDRVGSLVVQRLDDETAEKLLQRLVRKYPDRWGVETARARYLLAQGEGEKALAALEKALALRGDEATIYPLMAEAYLSADQAEIGLSRLGAYARRHPDDWALQRAYAGLEMSAGDLKAAEARLRRIVEHHPQAASARLALGLTQLELGRLDEAEKMLLSLIKNPVVAQRAGYYLGRIYEMKGDARTALGYYLQIRDPRLFVDARLRAVQLAAKEKGVDFALQALSEIDGASAADSVRIAAMRARLLRQAGRAEEAVKALKAAEDEGMEELTALQALIEAAREVYPPEEYARLMQRAVTRYPDDAMFLNELGYWYARHGENLAQAREMLEKAHSLKPEDPAIWDSLGTVYYRLGRLDEADGWISRALERMQRTQGPMALAQDYLWDVLLHLFQVKAAKGDWQAFDRLRQRYENVIDAVAELKSAVEALARQRRSKKSDGVVDF